MVNRIAALDVESCHSKKCGTECVRFCPVNKSGSECVILNSENISVINEVLCTGCGICVKKCPFSAITIVNLAEELKTEKIHQFNINSFRLYRLPTIGKSGVIGLVGKNGVGKSTTLNILSGNLKPNLGKYNSTPGWDEILENFKGTEYKDHFEKIASEELRVSVKPQAVYHIPKLWKGDGKSLLKKFDDRGVASDLIEQLNLGECISKPVSEISGGEFQRLAIAVAAAKDADLYFFDEPASFNDVFQRMAVAQVIRELAGKGKTIVLAEHDLTFLDYISDYIHIFYGESGAYGVISGIQSSRTGINVLLDGYLPEENVRFREKPVTFKALAASEENLDLKTIAEYSNILKKYPGFELHIDGGKIKENEVLGVLGANALGKTTFLRIVAGVEKAEKGKVKSSARISYKPQYLDMDVDKSVIDLLQSASGDKLESGSYRAQIIDPFGIEKLMDKTTKELSGGELQKVAIATCLLQDADIYALDEPSAFIDIEDRISLAKTINRFIKSHGKSAIVVDHDIQIIDIVADKLLIFTGTSGVNGRATASVNKEKGMNTFLHDLGITYRRDIESGRPRVNKPGSKMDRFQKESGAYYYRSSGIEE